MIYEIKIKTKSCNWNSIITILELNDIKCFTSIHSGFMYVNVIKNKISTEEYNKFIDYLSKYIY